MNNMNQRPGNCSQNCGADSVMNMNDRRCRGNMNGNSCGKRASMPVMPPTSGGCSCNCKDESTSIQNDPLRGMPVGIGYVPWQQWDCAYTAEEGLARGTIFPALDLPFYGCIPRGFHCNKGGR